MGNYYNYSKKNSKLGFVIKLIIFLIIVVFVYGCYNFDFLKNNEYIRNAREKVDEFIAHVTNSTKEGLSMLIENYEPDEKDFAVYEITDAQDRYYYNQLDEPSKVIYAEILENVDRIKKGEDNIKISSSLAVYMSEEDLSNTLMQSFQDAWDAFRNDNVDMFYIDGTKMCLITKTIKRGNKVSYEFYISRGDNKNYLIEGFSNEQDVDEAVAYIDSEEKKIVDSITEQNDYFKILKVHNWIVDNLSYNMRESNNNADIYGALKDKKVVCEGYARLFKSLMDKMGIPCILVSGIGKDTDTGSSENHAWNYVYLKGQWYAVDTTWDDPVIVGNGHVSQDTKYRFFLKGSDEFFKSHIEDGRFAENGKKFKYPEISKEDYIKEE